MGVPTDSTSTTSAGRGGLLRLILGQLAIFAGLLVAVDLALWLLLPIPNDGVYHQLTKVQSVPGLKPQVLYQTIGHRLRSVSMKTPAKPAGTICVLCLGASTTDQANQNTEDTWCALVEKEIRAGGGTLATTFHTVSYGRGGERAVDTARWLRQRIDIIKPDIVVTLLGVNDIAWNGGPGYAIRKVEDAKATEQSSGLEKLFTETCPNISQVCRLVQRAWNAVITARDRTSGKIVYWDSGNLPNLQEDYRNLPYVPAPIRQPDPYDEFRGAVAWLMQFLADRHIEVVALGQPVLWHANPAPDVADSFWFSVATPAGKVRPSPDWLAAEMKRYNEAQRQEAERRRLEFVDLDAAMPKTRAMYFDDCHFTDQGSAEIARLVAPAVKRVLARRMSRADRSAVGPAPL